MRLLSLATLAAVRPDLYEQHGDSTA